MKTLLTIKTDKKLKEAAAAVAAELGFPLGTIVNAQLRQLVRDRALSVRIALVPNKKTAVLLRRAIKDADEGKNMVGPFTNKKEIDDYLMAL